MRKDVHITAGTDVNTSFRQNTNIDLVSTIKAYIGSADVTQMFNFYVGENGFIYGKTNDDLTGKVVTFDVNAKPYFAKDESEVFMDFFIRVRDAYFDMFRHEKPKIYIGKGLVRVCFVDASAWGIFGILNGPLSADSTMISGIPIMDYLKFIFVEKGITFDLRKGKPVIETGSEVVIIFYTDMVDKSLQLERADSDEKIDSFDFKFGNMYGVAFFNGKVHTKLRFV